MIISHFVYNHLSHIQHIHNITHSLLISSNPQFISRNIEMATRLNMLPEDCVSTIISLTSPPDACRIMHASASLRSAAESDNVWSRFLPSDLPRILTRSHTKLNFSSKKDLFFQLCDSILIDGGVRSFSINKVSGKKCCVLSARALTISSSYEPNHWTWTTNFTSRFHEVIELKTISNIELEGIINTEDLSPDTTYGAYLIIKVSDNSFGLDSIPSEVSVSREECSVTNTAYLCPLDNKKKHLGSLFFMNRRQMMEKRVVEGEGRRPRKREDGWMEIELGEFFVGVKNERVRMSLMEVKGHQLKGGLTVEGIELRPKC
ncbi:F-box domain, cyclin-like protein [Artemisia annua]|uniref:F-box domain, cyclin-like protein n=1 Tax=Artemisia annua TaxID=35608 RepID=A0A2U1LE04_ARTAN|nr:F-box domain, cyclin-like protein [Artemisia annua]